MNKQAIIWSALGGIALIEYQRYSRLIDTFSLSSDSFKLKLVNKNLVVNFNLNFINNSDKSLKISGIRGVIYHSGVIIGRFTSNQKANCKADSTTKIPITATLFPSASISALVSGEAKNIILQSYTKIGFDLLGILPLPITISDKTTFKTDGFIRDVIDYIQKWNESRLNKDKQ